MRWRVGVAIAIGGSLVVMASGCGLFLGFEDPVDLKDGGLGAGAGPQGTACVAAAPSGWQGPLIVAEGSGDPPPALPGCPEGYQSQPVYEGQSDPVAPDATCSCKCMPAENVTCSDPVMDFFSDGMCNTACGKPVTIGVTCTMVSAGGCPNFRVEASAPMGGSCMPDPTVDVSAPKWTKNARVCAPASASRGKCSSGELETPAAGLPFEPATYCIAHKDVVMCPTEYPAQRIYYAAAMDARGCSPCACSDPSGGSCSGMVTVADNGATCMGGTANYQAPSACQKMAKVGAVFKESAMNPGTCTPTGGQPMGTFTPTTPTTICCTQ